MFLAVDVHYEESGAIAAGVVFENWESTTPLHSVVSKRRLVEDYEPGLFYRRELPCILDLLQDVGESPQCILVDGYVYLDGVSRPGLGKHLYDALQGRVRVVGVAKTQFRGIGPQFEVRRGNSEKPLYVTCVGEELAVAKAGVKAMHGAHRIPTMLKAVDQLCRQNAT